MQTTSEKVSQRELSTFKKYMLLAEFVLVHNLEDTLVEFLETIKHDSMWDGFHEEIDDQIQQFEITEEEIEATMRELFIL